MKKFTVPAYEEVSPANQAIFDNLKKGIGFVPNVYAFLAHSQGGLGRYLAFLNAKSSLTNKEKEAVNLVVSQVNGCTYCLSAHTVIGKMNGLTDPEVLTIRSGNGPDERLTALVGLAKDIAINRGRASSDKVDAFFAAGYTEGSLVDLILQVSDITVTNYVNNLTEVPVDFPVAPELESAELV
jgi:uncharacterized peroxidase-related enzyme